MLTEKQKLFCKEYLKSKNATEAYLKAYKCTPKTANSNGCKLLTNDKIKEYLEELVNNLHPLELAVLGVRSGRAHV